MDTKNIFKKSEQIIHQNALPKNSLTRAGYACFDPFYNTQRDLLVGERALCLEFQRLVENYKIGIWDILAFVDELDYEVLYVKTSCYMSLDNHNLNEAFSQLQMIEVSGYSGVLTVNISYFKRGGEIGGELEIPNKIGVNLKKRLDIHNNSFEFGFDGENASEMYSFVTQICEELHNNNYDYDEVLQKNDYNGNIDVSEFECEFLLSPQANTEVFEKLYNYFQKFGVDKLVIDELSDGSINNLHMEVHIDGKVDESYDVVEFSWDKDRLEILKYLEDLELHYGSLTLEITQVLDY